MSSSVVDENRSVFVGIGVLSKPFNQLEVKRKSSCIRTYLSRHPGRKPESAAAQMRSQWLDGGPHQPSFPRMRLLIGFSARLATRMNRKRNR